MSVGFNCEAGTANTGTVCKNVGEIGHINQIFLEVPSHSFVSEASFATEADWITAIRNQNIFPLEIAEVQAADEETTYIDTPLGNQIEDRKGNYRAKYMANVPFCIMKKLHTFQYFGGQVYKATQKGQIIGYSPDDIAVRGLRIQLLNPEKIKIPPPGEYNWIPIHINEKDWQDFNINGRVVTPTWNPAELKGLKDVTLEVVGAPLATVIVVKASIDCGLDSDGSAYEIPVIGLVTADFTILTAAGVAQGVTFADNGDGTYTGSDTDLETGTIALVDPNSIVDTAALLDGTTQVSFTV